MMILGIDFGSTYFKATVFDQKLIPRGTGAALVAYTPSKGNQVEMPVSETEASLHETIAEALHNANVKGSELDAIAITGQAQTFSVLSPTGNSRLPFISWRDVRSEGNCQAADALPDFEQHCSVDECSPLLMLSKLEWMQNKLGGSLVGKDDLVLMLPTWFILQLTGKAVVDTNLAAMSGLYSLREDCWWDEALSVCGISERNLPSLAKLGTAAGKTMKSAQRYGLPPGIPVVLAGNDQTAGAYGAGIHEKDAMLITLGTSQVAYVVCDHLPTPNPGVMRGPYPGGRAYQLVADDHGAGTVHWARTVLDGCRSEDDFERAAAHATADCGGVRFLADGPAGSGHWIGNTSQTTEADKSRAVLLCLAERMAKNLESLHPSASKKRILLAGGGSNSDVWLKCLQQWLRKPLHRVQNASPALGAARMAKVNAIG